MEVHTMKKLIALVIVAMFALTAFAALAENGTLTMCTNAQFPPYEFYGDDGETIVGIDADIARAICEKIGYTLEIKDIDFDACIPGVKEHKFDFAAAGMTVTEERKEMVQFTDTYATGIQVVIVPEDSAFTSIDDIVAANGSAKIGVQAGTTGALYCTWDYEDEGKGEVHAYKSGGAAVAALQAGKEDCVVIDNEPAKNFVAQNEGLKILETAYTTEDYAMAFAKDSEVYEAFNAALAELIADGTVQGIIDQYIPAE
ncbi:MAG: transporter substrate-binding domain-containing protein [Clostridia bacterium]|nr:transporter substrate-binding domain-containing protein [Clostridia bacterium]